MPRAETSKLTVPEVATRLGMTADGVYKLIQRGKLEAVRESARKTRVTQGALEQFIAEQQAAVHRFREAANATDPGILRERFVSQTGYSPEQWLSAWKRDEIDDTAENMRLVVRALALREQGGEAPISKPKQDPWAVAAFSTGRRAGR